MIDLTECVSAPALRIHVERMLGVFQKIMNLFANVLVATMEIHTSAVNTFKDVVQTRNVNHLKHVLMRNVHHHVHADLTLYAMSATTSQHVNACQGIMETPKPAVNHL